MPCLLDISVKAQLISAGYEARWIIAFNTCNDSDECIYAILTEDRLEWTRAHRQCILKTIEFRTTDLCRNIETLKGFLWFPGQLKGLNGPCCSMKWV
ncbi:hypothetical protein BDV26DRAFT_262924 [Aspergillus bertholletiae]|uniref:Uncharacterized protein n=1 Tax=Aspergillus bertholletiae TaxID=1226010 RepID=A0A5N7B7P9_9EURO|nr:hypothetical protein BDV26DRAFT_262924 [Aspergillus bertholletiae]